MQPSRHYRPKLSSGYQHLALVLTIGYTLLLVYGTLFPLSGWQAPGTSPWVLMLQRGLRNTSKPDILTNLLVYLPLGLLLMRTLAGRPCAVCSVMGVTLASALLSLALEYSQAHLPGRVPSIMDVLLNTAGGFSGALLALGMRPDSAIGARLYRLRYTYIHPGPLANLGLFTLSLWVLSQLSPLIPSIDLGNLRHGLKPLWHSLQNPTMLEWLRVIEYSLSITVVGILGSTLLRIRYNALWIITTFTCLILLLKIPVLGRQLSLEALLGLVTGLVFTAFLYHKSLQTRLMVAVCAILGTVLASGLYVPAEAMSTYQGNTFNWIPFRSHLVNNITGIIDILGGLWPFFALGYFARLVNGKQRLMLAGAAVVFSLVFALEWIQQYLPGRSPDITDAMIATMAWLLPMAFTNDCRQ